MTRNKDQIQGLSFWETAHSFLSFYLENKTRKVSHTIYQLDRTRSCVNFTSLKSEHISTVWLDAVYLYALERKAVKLPLVHYEYPLQEIYAVFQRAAIVKQGHTHLMVLRVWNSCTTVLNTKSQATHVSIGYWFFQDLLFYSSSPKENLSHLSTGLMNSGYPVGLTHNTGLIKSQILKHSNLESVWEFPHLFFPLFHSDRNFDF